MDLLDQNDITAIRNPANKEKIELFVELASIEIAETQNNKMLYYRISRIDFDDPIKDQLLELVKEIESSDISLIEDDFYVKINLKDENIRAFAQRFAWSERE